ncbi:MAG TPA: beta-propeller domain-containing protein [Cellvibrionaceae bacterium]
MNKLLLIASISVWLAACGGGDSSPPPTGEVNPPLGGGDSNPPPTGEVDPPPGGGDSNPPPTGEVDPPPGAGNPVDYSKLQYATPDSQPLVTFAGNALERYLENGLRLQVAGQHYENPNEMANWGGVDFSPAPPVADNAGAERYSDTNVHVAGVDEADLAKYDGEHWYVIYQPQSSGELPGLQIVATNPAVPDAEIVGTHGFAGEQWSAPGAIYLAPLGAPAQQVVALRSQWGNVSPRLPGFMLDFAASDFWWPQNSELEVAFINVQNPAAPTQGESLFIEGSLIDSRRLDETLYVITRFDPWLEGLEYDGGDTPTRTANEALLAETSLDDLLPHYRKGDQRLPLTEDCFVQEAEENMGYTSLVHITAIDLATGDVSASECISSAVNAISMSPEALYLTGNIWQDDASQTVIHKFDLPAAGPAYTATGHVPGGLGWRSDPAFRLHEHKGDLRVVTTDGQDWGWGGNIDIVHRLFVLEQAGDQLLPVAAMPNEARPAAIGKPGEDIYAVRFTDSRAYIVTFRQVDPLYAIDLSEREDPQILGELEVPGFASYIHPLNDDYLFTLGQDATGQGLVQGLRLQLVKVSGANPELVSLLQLGGRGSYSEGLDDLHALSFLWQDDSSVRLALPVSVSQDYHWRYNGLQMLELNGLDTTDASMIDKGTLVAESNNNGMNYYGGGVHRGLLHNDAVFYAHDNRIWFTHWGDASSPGGPIGGDPVACTDDIRYGLNVLIDAPDCNITVTATDGSYSETLVRPDDNSYCSFQGAAERPGLYQVTATRGEATASAQVRVSADVCHVQTRYVNLVLE